MGIARPRIVPLLLVCAVACGRTEGRKTAGSPPRTAAEHAPDPAVAASAGVPTGLIAVRPIHKPGAIDPRTVSNPNVSGIATQLEWRVLEPTPGKPDWSKIDAFIGPAEASKKWVRLILIPGMGSPPWALEGAKVEQFARPYGYETGKVETEPMPWDQVYLNRWFELLGQVAERYGRSPAFKMIAAAGPTSVTAESTLPHGQGDVEKWIAAGYTSQRYVDAWKQTFQTYAKLFPGQYVSWSLGGGVEIDEHGKRDPSATARSRQAIIDLGIEILGPRFVLMCDDLHVTPPRQEFIEMVRQYSGRVTTGFEMMCRVTPPGCGEVMESEGNPPVGFKKAVDRAFEPTKSGKHISFLEVYEGDFLAPEMQDVLRDTADRLRRP